MNKTWTKKELLEWVKSEPKEVVHPSLYDNWFEIGNKHNVYIYLTSDTDTRDELEVLLKHITKMKPNKRLVSVQSLIDETVYYVLEVTQ